VGPVESSTNVSVVATVFPALSAPVTTWFGGFAGLAVQLYVLDV
jgi:hypothetical protein